LKDAEQKFDMNFIGSPPEKQGETDKTRGVYSHGNKDL
jgi:hypothetical protein